MSLSCPMPSAVTSAIKGWGISVTHSSQCLYIKSSTIWASALSRLGYSSVTRLPYLMFLMIKIFVSSGENKKPSTPPSTFVNCLRSLPSGLMVNTCIPSSGEVERNAIFLPPLIHTAPISGAEVSVMRTALEPSMPIVHNSLLPLSASRLINSTL